MEEPPFEAAPALHENTAPPDSVWSLAAFWIVAFVGASLFAAVLIAPRWEERQALRARVSYQSMQCAYLGDVNDHFKRVIDAFKHDPDFNAEVARVALGYVAANEERVAAPVQNWARPRPPHIEPITPDLLDPFIRLFARDKVVRHTALISAAIFIVVSLAFFNARSESERTP
jgi:hypothetical protein